MKDFELFASFILTIAAGLLLAFVLYRVKKRGNDADAVHVFLDLETLGIRYDAPVLVIAAYAVDAAGSKVAEGCWRIDPVNARLYGEADPATVKWWSERSDEAKHEAFEAGPRVKVPEALQGLTNFIKALSTAYGDQVFVWGNAPTLDCTVLRYAYAAAEMPVPWAYWQERDVRTVAWVGEAIGYDAKGALKFEGHRHIALDDARHQARYTMQILKKLGA